MLNKSGLKSLLLPELTHAEKRREEKGASLEVAAPPTPAALAARTNHQNAPEETTRVECWERSNDALGPQSLLTVFITLSRWD